MKKLFTLLVISLSMLSLRTIAQNNLTWVMKEKADDAYFNRTRFNYSVSGFTNQQEAGAFYAKMKENPDVVSAEDKGKDATGNYNVLVIMKKAQNKDYYLNWSVNLGVSYIITFKGEKKTPQEILAESKKKDAKMFNKH
jgi:hypothetical protein